jgi:hypothetical protein
VCAPIEAARRRINKHLRQPALAIANAMPAYAAVPNITIPTRRIIRFIAAPPRRVIRVILDSPFVAGKVIAWLNASI